MAMGAYEDFVKCVQVNSLSRILGHETVVVSIVSVTGQWPCMSHNIHIDISYMDVGFTGDAWEWRC